MGPAAGSSVVKPAVQAGAHLGLAPGSSTYRPGTLGQWFKRSALQFPHLENGDNNFVAGQGVKINEIVVEVSMRQGTDF